MASNKIQQALNNRIQKHIKEYAFEQIGRVIKTYYTPTNENDIDDFNKLFADVEIIDETVNEKRILEEVPIVVNPAAPNIDGYKIKKGDRVIISFYKGNRVYPRITGKYYKNNTRSKEMKKEWGVMISNAYGQDI
ncbi:MAG: hypothetical protein ACOCRO_02185 [Halanaerobiales bacterium]